MSGKPNDKMFKTMIKKFGSEEAARAWFRELGRRGGAASGAGGFASTNKGKDGMTGPERASIVGKKGGMISRRKPKNLTEKSLQTI